MYSYYYELVLLVYLYTRQVNVVCATHFGASMDSMLSSYPEDETEEIFPVPVG